MRTIPRPNRQLKPVNSVPALLRKKKLKRLIPKKKVRFNLMTKASSSEIVLSRSLPMESLKPDVQQGLELKSQSCVSIATPCIISRLSYPRPFLTLDNQIETQSQTNLKYCKIKSLKKYIQCFNDLYFLGPIFNLRRKMPANGILKRAHTSLFPLQNKHNLSVNKPLLTLANITGINKCYHPISSDTSFQPVSLCKSGSSIGDTDFKDVIQRNIFDSMATSIQELHISTQSPGDQYRKEISAPAVQFSFNFPSYYQQVGRHHNIFTCFNMDIA